METSSWVDMARRWSRCSRCSVRRRCEKDPFSRNETQRPQPVRVPAPTTSSRIPARDEVGVVGTAVGPRQPAVDAGLQCTLGQRRDDRHAVAVGR